MQRERQAEEDRRPWGGAVPGVVVDDELEWLPAEAGCEKLQARVEAVGFQVALSVVTQGTQDSLEAADGDPGREPEAEGGEERPASPEDGCSDGPSTLGRPSGPRSALAPASSGFRGPSRSPPGHAVRPPRSSGLGRS